MRCHCTQDQLAGPAAVKASLGTTGNETKHDAFNRNFNKLSPETVRLINEGAITGAVELKIENGKKSRVDSTLSETDIHYPTDASLLSDSVRVITRLVGRLSEMFPKLSEGFYVSRTKLSTRLSKWCDNSRDQPLDHRSTSPQKKNPPQRNWLAFH